MKNSDPPGNALDLMAHELSQQLQIIAMALAAIERRDGERHGGDVELARRALEILDRSVEELIARARRD